MGSMSLRFFSLMTLSFALVGGFHHQSRAALKDDYQVKLVKSKGKKSLVVVTERLEEELPPGTYVLSKSNTTKPVTEAYFESRNNSISGSLSSEMLKVTTKTNSSETSADVKTFDANLTYGWNFTDYEFGPFIAYSFQTQGESDVKTLTGGAFFDWNFVSNLESSNYVPGLRLQVGAGQVDNSGLNEAYNVNIIQAGLFVKCFFLSSNLAFVPELAYKSSTANPNNSTIQTTGTLFRLGIINYF